MPYIHGKSLIKIAVAEDETVLREPLCDMMNTWENCKIILQVKNGRELMQQIDPKNLPDLVLVDLKMPVMNGYETMAAIKKIYPEIKLLVLSFYNSEEVLLKIIREGAHGFVNKSDDACLFKKAIYETMKTGYYFEDPGAARIIKQIRQSGNTASNNCLSDKEIFFLKCLATDKTYKEISRIMKIPDRQVEYIRTILFNRFEVDNRSALAVMAIQTGLVV